MSPRQTSAPVSVLEELRPPGGWHRAAPVARPPLTQPPAPEPQRWQDQSACRGLDPDLFFPERGASTRDAKAVCASCPVRAECLEHALARGEKFGIWGGTSERERRALRRQRRLAAIQAQQGQAS